MLRRTPVVDQTESVAGGMKHEYGEFVMELRVHLKVCEGCGCLWYRPQSIENVYCKACETKLRDFPSPESRKRRGRPVRRKLLHLTLDRVWAVASEDGGDQ